MIRRLLLVVVAIAVAIACSREPAPDDASLVATAQPVVSGTPCVKDPLKKAYFGDLHVHTSYSLDAWVSGTRNDPFQSYFFARGVSMTDAAGRVLTNPRPLDFSIVSDHSEFLDVIGLCTLPDANGNYNQDPYCVSVRAMSPVPELPDEQKQWYHYNPFVLLNDVYGTYPPDRMEVCKRYPGACSYWSWNLWARTQIAADWANQPCEFTALKGYEWSEGTKFMHRVVVFGTGQVPSQPLDYIDFYNVPMLMNGLMAQCKPEDGCDAITIPHNSNLTSGNMFSLQTGELALRAKYDRLAEVFQIKGASECLNTGDPEDDPDCAFEIMKSPGNDPAIATWGYVRKGLQAGLVWQSIYKVNPMEMGLVAATDTHNATAGFVEESQPIGHSGFTDNEADERLTGGKEVLNGGGLTGVWAEENTRGAIFAAMKRRETFGTSGPRIKVRFWQTWEQGDLCADSNLVERMKTQGVPMGSRFSGTGTPKFVVLATKDVTDLAAIHVVKGTLVNGELVETVERFTAFPGEEGAMCRSWSDTGYQANAPSFWYARVLEKPVPRWSAYDCALHPTMCTGEKAWLTGTIQERAWTSPIFRLPQ